MEYNCAAKTAAMRIMLLFRKRGTFAMILCDSRDHERKKKPAQLREKQKKRKKSKNRSTEKYVRCVLTVGRSYITRQQVFGFGQFVRAERGGEIVLFLSYAIVQQPDLQPNSPLALENMLLAGSPRASRFSFNSSSACFILSSTAVLTCGSSGVKKKKRKTLNGYFNINYRLTIVFI